MRSACLGGVAGLSQLVCLRTITRTRHPDGMDQPRRVYGSDHDDPGSYAQPRHAYVERVGGPLDGLLVDVTDWPERDVREGAALITEIGAYGGGGRAWYSARDGDTTRWHWDGDSP